MRMSRPELQESCDGEGHHQEGAAYDGVGVSGYKLAPPDTGDRWKAKGDRDRWSVHLPIKEILQTLSEKVADFLDEEHHPCQWDPTTARNWNKGQ